MVNTNNYLAEAIQTIANSEQVKKKIEPNTIWHNTISKNDVQRVLYAFLLFENEAQKPKPEKTIFKIQNKHC